jgi:hypothetical protein
MVPSQTFKLPQTSNPMVTKSLLSVIPSKFESGAMTEPQEPPVEVSRSNPKIAGLPLKGIRCRRKDRRLTEYESFQRPTEI